MTDTGTIASQIIECPQCGALNSLNVGLSSDTPGVTLQAMVIAAAPCPSCFAVSRSVVRFGEQT